MNLRDAGAGRRCRPFLLLAIDPAERFSDRVQQVFFVERLVHKLHRGRLHGTHQFRSIAVARGRL
jgi:hypothetical protein